MKQIYISLYNISQDIGITIIDLTKFQFMSMSFRTIKLQWLYVFNIRDIKASTKINSIPEELKNILSLRRLPTRRILNLTIEKAFIQQSLKYETQYKDDLINAERKYSDAEKRCSLGLRAINQLENINAQMLRSHGQLNMRGVLDYIEDWCKNNLGVSYKNRKDMFIKFFDSPQVVSLTYNICDVTRYKKDELSDIFVRMWGKLSGSLHDRRTPDEHKRDDTKIHIVKGALDIDDCRALEQVCKFFVFPYEPDYK